MNLPHLPAVDGLHAPDTTTYTANRCHCRPGCLTEVRPGEQVIPVADGVALTAHLKGQL